MITLLPEEQRDKVKKKDLIDLEFQIVTDLEFDLQWAGPIPFAERYVKLLQVNDHNQILYLATQFCKFAAHRSELNLAHKPSLVAASAVLLALNVSTSQLISQDIGINLLSLQSIKSGAGPLGWIESEFEMATGLSPSAVCPVYQVMLSQLDELILENKLKQDPAIWISPNGANIQNQI